MRQQKGITPTYFINSPSNQTLNSIAKSRNKKQTETSNEDKRANRESAGTQKSLMQTLDSFSTKKNLNKSKTARGDDLKHVI